MAEHISIGDISPRVQYSGTGSQVTFTYPFPIFEDANMAVYVDTALQESGYTVTGAGNDNGGSVIFDTAPADGADITLVREVTVERTSDFQESGEFRAKVINDELDRIVAMLQELADDLSRSPILATTDTAVDLTLPDKVTRAGRLFGWDMDGKPMAAAGSSGAAVSTFMATVLDDADAAAVRASLGVQADLDLPSQAEAEAGTATTERVWTAERIGQAVTALGGNKDQTARDIAVAALVEANAAGVSGTKGPLVGVDPYTSDSLDTSTNATYDAAAGKYHNPGGVGSGIPLTSGMITIGGTFNNPSATNLVDGNTSTTGFEMTGDEATDTIDVDLGASNDKAVAKIGFYVLNSGANNQAAEWSFSHSDNGTDWTDTTQGLSVTDDGNDDWQEIEIAGQTAHRYWRFTVDSTTANGNGGYRELRMYEVASPGNMTLLEGSLAISTADPTDLSAYFRIKPIDSLTMGTDVVGTLSIDNGTTKATGTWTKVGDFGSEELWRLDADVSGQSGSTVLYELTGANNKHWELHGTGGVLPIY